MKIPENIDSILFWFSGIISTLVMSLSISIFFIIYKIKEWYNGRKLR